MQQMLVDALRTDRPTGMRRRAVRLCRRAPLAVLGCALLIGGAGCSLISLKNPERPLSARDLNARILTRELSAQFQTAVVRCAANIAATEEDETVLDNTLRWEISAVGASRSASTQIAPMLGLLDTWALAAQMQAFMAAGAAGGALFGTHQEAVRQVSDDFADGTTALAKRLLSPQDFSRDQTFVEQYAQQHPLVDLSFARASVVELWSREQGSHTKLIDSLGTFPEVMADAEQRLQIYGDTVPPQLMHETQLALRQSGYSRTDVNAALKQLDERLARLADVAQSTPQLVQGAIADVRQSLREVVDRLDASSKETTAALNAQRAALFSNIQSEREVMVAAVDTQRKAFAADATRVADGVVRSAGEQLRRLVAEVLLLLILLFAVVLGLPFAAGYFLGRARRERGAP
ncbi:MAG: hypothetical protein WA747_04680 [Steroidobacteraceae bacterium]